MKEYNQCSKSVLLKYKWYKGDEFCQSLRTLGWPGNTRLETAGSGADPCSRLGAWLSIFTVFRDFEILGGNSGFSDFSSFKDF